MQVSHDPMGMDEGKAWLDELPGLYFSALKQVELEVLPEEGMVSCAVEFPGLGKTTRHAATANEAIERLVSELTAALIATSFESWPKEWHEVSNIVAGHPAKDIEDLGGSKGRFQAKVRQATIGVTMPTRLKESIQLVADERSNTFAKIAREMVSKGFEDFDERIFVESSDDLLNELEADLEHWLPSDKEQVMLRIDPSLGVRMRSTAKEYRKSASEFGCLFLAHGFQIEMNMEEVDRVISSYKGPAARRLAREVGVGDSVPLISGVLGGTISPPAMLLEKLSQIIQAPVASLRESFRRSSYSRAVPAYKSEEGKPELKSCATPWDEAVRSLSLSKEETERLLSFEDRQ